MIIDRYDDCKFDSQKVQWLTDMMCKVSSQSFVISLFMLPFTRNITFIKILTILNKHKELSNWEKFFDFTFSCSPLLIK